MKKSQSIRVIAAHRLVLAAAAEPRRGCCGEGEALEGQVEKVGREMSGRITEGGDSEHGIRNDVGRFVGGI